MKVLNLLTSGNIGGIESLCRDIGQNSNYENGFCFLFEGGVIYEQMKESGLVTYCLQDRTGKFSYEKWKQLCQIAINYDVIVVHHGDPILKFYFYMLTLKFKKKFVTVVHSCFEEKYFYPDNNVKYWLGKMIFQHSLTVSDKVIFVSNAGKKSYEKAFKISKEKCCVIYNGIGMDKLDEGRSSEICLPKTYHITYIGRLNKVKGIDLLVEAVSMLANRYQVQLAIIGDGETRKNLEQQVNKLGIESIVTFYGKQVDVIPFLKQTDIFVYPSVWQEVFGISVVEAMAFGKICVANCVGGLPEIIKDGENGFLTEKVSVEGVAEAIKRAILCYQYGSYEIVSEKAKQTAERFSIQHTVEELRQVYRNILNSDR